MLSFCLVKVKLHHCATLAIERSSASDVAETIEHHLGVILGLVWSHRYVYNVFLCWLKCRVWCLRLARASAIAALLQQSVEVR